MSVMSVTRIGMADTGQEIMKYVVFSQAPCVWCADATPKQKHDRKWTLFAKERAFSI